MRATFGDVLRRTHESLRRRRGNCGVALGAGDSEFSLIAGAPSAVKVDRGVIVTLGLSRERLLGLRDEIDELLADGSS